MVLNNPDRRRPQSPRWLTIVVIVILVGVALWQQRRQSTAPEAGEVTVTPTASAEPRSNLPNVRRDAGDTESASTTPIDQGPVQAKRGQLREVRKDVFESTAGLIYKRGGAEGHRIDHVLQHAVDDPDKPVHGVFRGDREIILALIDEAYQIAQERGPPDVTQDQDGNRTAYTIDLGRDIGYGGGQSGARKRNPPLSHLKLVLEGKNVITAYPTNQ
jgi:hypothetical protein